MPAIMHTGCQTVVCLLKTVIMDRKRAVCFTAKRPQGHERIGPGVAEKSPLGQNAPVVLVLRVAMKLTFKLVSVFMLAHIALAVVYRYLAVQRESRLFRQSTHAEANSLARSWKGCWPRPIENRQAVLECVRRANAEEEQLQIRRVDTSERAKVHPARRNGLVTSSFACSTKSLSTRASTQAFAHGALCRGPHNRGRQPPNTLSDPPRRGTGPASWRGVRPLRGPRPDRRFRDQFQRVGRESDHRRRECPLVNPKKWKQVEDKSQFKALFQPKAKLLRDGAKFYLAVEGMDDMGSVVVAPGQAWICGPGHSFAVLLVEDVLLFHLIEQA